MSLFMLDADAVSEVMRGSPIRDQHLIALDSSEWCISAITHAEICSGLAQRPEAIRIARAAAAFFRGGEIIAMGCVRSGDGWQAARSIAAS